MNKILVKFVQIFVKKSKEKCCSANFSPVAKVLIVYLNLCSAFSQTWVLSSGNHFLQLFAVEQTSGKRNTKTLRLLDMMWSVSLSNYEIVYFKILCFARITVCFPRLSAHKTGRRYLLAVAKCRLLILRVKLESSAEETLRIVAFAQSRYRGKSIDLWVFPGAFSYQIGSPNIAHEVSGLLNSQFDRRAFLDWPKGAGPSHQPAAAWVANYLEIALLILRVNLAYMCTYISLPDDPFAWRTLVKKVSFKIN